MVDDGLFCFPLPVRLLILCLGILFAASHSFCGEITAGPMYTLAEGSSDTITVDCAEVAIADSIYLAKAETPSGAVGRVYWTVPTHELGDLPPYRWDTTRPLFRAESEGYFDLWAAAEKLNAPPSSNLALSFQVRAFSSVRAYLQLACFDSATVFVNGSAVHGTYCSGVRIYVRARDIIPLELLAGVNRVTIVYGLGKSWQAIPRNHYCSDWMTSIALTTSAETSWLAHTSSTFHLTDTPLVQTMDDLRIDGIDAGTIALYFPGGARPVWGDVNKDGSIRWKSNVSEFNGIAIIRMKNLAEPIYICGGPLRSTITLSANTDGGGFWSRRVQHLMKSEFMNDRDIWWARKLVMALFMGKRDSFTHDAIAPCRVAGFGVLAYESSIDATVQFAMYWRDPALSTASWLVVAPFVPSTLRPPSESPTVANLCNQEDLVLASIPGTAILWPLYVDIDYGRDIAQHEIALAFQTMLHAFPQDRNMPHFVFGCCSGGVVALRFAAEMENIRGVLLYSPIVNSPENTLFAMNNEDASLRVLSPPESELIDQLVDRLSTKHVLLVYDSGMEGHGDLAGSKRLVEQLRRAGAHVDASWLPPVTNYMWGTKLNEHYLQWWRWIGGVASQTHLGPSNQGVAQKARASTIRGALLGGFTVTETTDCSLREWSKAWYERLCSYRGPRLKDTTGRATVVEYRRKISASEATFSVARSPRKDGGTVVEVSYVGPPGAKTLPLLDLLTTANFRSARWEERNGKWILDEVVLPDN